MSTEITVFTGDRDLVDRAKAQTQANRFARVDAEQQAKVQQSTEQLLRIMQPPATAVSRLGGRLFRHLFFSEEPIARRNANTGLLAFLLVPTEGFDSSVVGPFGDPTGAQFTSYGASPGLVRGYTNTYWTVTNWRRYFGYVVVGGVRRNIGRPTVQGGLDETAQQILPPTFVDGVLKGPVLKSKISANTTLNFFTGPWMERTISEVHLAHTVAARTNFRYRYDTSQQRLEYLDNTPLTLQLGARNAMTLEFIVQLGKDPIPADGGNLRSNQGLPFTEIKGLNQLGLRLEGYTSGVWGQGAYDKFDLYLRQGHGNDANSSNLLNFEGGQSVDNDPQSGDIVQYAEGEVRKTLWRPDYDYDALGTKTQVTLNGASFNTQETLAARPVHCALVFTNQETRFYIDGSLGYTAAPAPRLLSAQTLRFLLSLRDSSYKEYAEVWDFIDEDGSVTVNSDYFFDDSPRQAFIVILETVETYSFSRNIVGPGDFGDQTVSYDSAAFQIIPARSLNGVPVADEGALSPADFAKLKVRYLASYRLNVMDSSIMDRAEALDERPTPDGVVNEVANYEGYVFRDQYGVPIVPAAGPYYTKNFVTRQFTPEIVNEGGTTPEIGFTTITKKWCNGIPYVQQRLPPNAAPIIHQYDKHGNIERVGGNAVKNAQLVGELDNPRSTIFNGPSSISGIRLTSQELYVGETVQVPSAITSLDPENDILITPPGPPPDGGGQPTT